MVEAGRDSTRAMARMLWPSSFMLEITMRSSGRSCVYVVRSVIALPYRSEVLHFGFETA
jgi:hypothetical protein